MGTAIVGALCFLIGAWMFWRKKARKTQVWLMLIAGICSIGLIGEYSRDFGEWLVERIGQGSTVVVGVGAGLLVGTFLLLELYHAAHPKKGRPQAYHPWMALMTGPLMIAGGGVFAQGVGLISDGAEQVSPTLTQWLG